MLSMQPTRLAEVVVIAHCVRSEALSQKKCFSFSCLVASPCCIFGTFSGVHIIVAAFSGHNVSDRLCLAMRVCRCGIVRSPRFLVAEKRLGNRLQLRSDSRTHQSQSLYCKFIEYAKQGDLRAI